MTLSRRLALFLSPLAITAPAMAQDVYGPSDFASEADSDTPVPLVEATPCEEEVREDGAIVVCRELPDTQRYMSPLPRPVQSDRRIIPGLTEPPCWVTQGESLSCMRLGTVPPYPPLIDLTAFPEPLSKEEAAAVSAVETDDTQETRASTGERVPIDLSGDD